jgi:hypothetical protein
MNMSKMYLFFASILLAILFNSCGSKYLEVDKQVLQTKIYDPTAIKYQSLQQSTVLYLDHSTCVIDAVQNSEVFKAVRPNLGQYCDTLRLIKGDSFESIPLNKKENKVSEVLETINTDISFADIRSAVFNICNDNQQAILISDCESYANGRFLDLEPYMSEPFKIWLSKGHSIYIITEPYQEKYKGRTYDKKRFFIIFTDDKLQAPISNVIKAEIQGLMENGVCTWFKMTNSDISIESPKSDMVNPNLTFNVDYLNGFEFISIDDSWEAIREYVMKLDKYGEPIPEEKSEPLISNLILVNGENFKINDIQVEATNITSKYLALEDSSVTANEINISDGFVLDKVALKSNKLNVLLTDKIFTDSYLLGKEYGGNLIRLDFVITQIELNPYESNVFEWQSIWSTNNAICVSKSIDNAIRDVNVIPTSPNRRVIHTIFIKTESY